MMKSPPIFPYWSDSFVQRVGYQIFNVADDVQRSTIIKRV
jgi:hypothetical protein